jgi:hypothetical protein
MTMAKRHPTDRQPRVYYYEKLGRTDRPFGLVGLFPYPGSGFTLPWKNLSSSLGGTFVQGTIISGGPYVRNRMIWYIFCVIFGCRIVQLSNRPCVITIAKRQPIEIQLGQYACLLLLEAGTDR